MRVGAGQVMHDFQQGCLDYKSMLWINFCLGASNDDEHLVPFLDFDQMFQARKLLFSNIML